MKAGLNVTGRVSASVFPLPTAVTPEPVIVHWPLDVLPAAPGVSGDPAAAPLPASFCKYKALLAGR